jgi:DNA-directed RNA polymerase subunit RPC12/RpoP
MEEQVILCRQCRNIFRIPGNNRGSIGQEISCPKCASTNLEEAPAWAPLGSGLNLFETSGWEYECQLCHDRFKMPIPKSPTEEKARKCPACGNGHLHRLTIKGGEPLYCG